MLDNVRPYEISIGQKATRSKSRPPPAAATNDEHLTGRRAFRIERLPHRTPHVEIHQDLILPGNPVSQAAVRSYNVKRTKERQARDPWRKLTAAEVCASVGVRT